MKDTRGLWTGDYYGSVTIGYNANVVKTPPKTFADLLKSIYKNQVALNGSPLKSGSAIAGVFAAALANGGSLSNVGPGIDWFAKRRSNGNWVPVRDDAADGRVRPDADLDRLGLQQLRLREGVPVGELEGRPPQRRPVRRLLLPGGQRDGAAPVGRPPVAGVPLLRPGADPLPEGLRTSRPHWPTSLARKAIPKSVTAALPASWLNAKGAKFASLGQQTKAGVVIKAEWPAKIGG